MAYQNRVEHLPGDQVASEGSINCTVKRVWPNLSGDIEQRSSNAGYRHALLNSLTTQVHMKRPVHTELSTDNVFPRIDDDIDAATVEPIESPDSCGSEMTHVTLDTECCGSSVAEPRPRRGCMSKRLRMNLEPLAIRTSTFDLMRR